MTQQVTRLVRLTPPGQGAVATLLLSGPDALSILNRSITPQISLDGSDFRACCPVFALFSVFSSSDNRKSYHEEVVLSIKNRKNIEIHCHGGEIVIAAVEHELIRSGAQKILQLTDFFDHFHKIQSKIQLEAFQLFLQAETEWTGKILLTQVHGKLNEELQNILSAINKPDIANAETGLDQLLKTASVHCVEPFQVALIGPVNVGKSSLFNALIGFERTIVTDVPGTTRDLVSGTTAFQGWPILLIDTAGIRETDDRIEQLGINLSQSVTDQADLVLCVCDVSEKNTQSCNKDRSTITIYNKTDLSETQDLQNGEDLFYVSAKTGFGLQPLINGILKRLIPHLPRIGAPVLFTHDQVKIVQKIKTSLKTGDVSDAIMLLEQMLD